MNLEIFNDIQEKITDIKSEIKQNTQEEKIELAKKLDLVEEYSVDRFEEEYVVLENRRTKEKKNIEKNILPQNIKEGDILQYINGEYITNEDITKEERNRIQNKMNKLWN